MKWIFLTGLVFLVPLLMRWLQADPRAIRIVGLLIGFLPFAIAPFHLYVAPLSWATWPGFVKGAEVSLLDGVAIAVLLGAPTRRRRVVLKAPLLLLILTAALSILVANVPTAAMFYVWQLLRMFLVFLAVAKLCQHEQTAYDVVTGMVAGLSIQAGFAALDYLNGVLQSGGKFGHQNQLGILSHFAIYPALALLLAGRKGLTPYLGPIAGVIVAITGASRATIGLAAIGMLLMLTVSIMRRPSSRKTAVAITGILALLLAAPLALGSLERRLAVNPLSEDTYDERAAFELASWMMLSDHPFGVGANGYVVAANVGGYSSRAGVIPSKGSRSAHVHNAYLLAAAEMGYLGLISFLILMLSPVIIAFRSAFRRRKDPQGELLLGVGVALTLVAAHSLYEWVFVVFSTQYLFAISVGLVSAISINLTDRGRKANNGRNCEPVHVQTA